MQNIRKKISDSVSGYVFLLPFLIGFMVFTAIPVCASIYFSFTEYNMLSLPKWVGFQNYKQMLFEDQDFWQSVKVTFYYVFVSVPIRVSVALLIAMLLNTRFKRLTSFYRTAFYLPTIIGSSVGVIVMWRQLFGYDGAVNSLLGILGVSHVNFLGNPKTAIWVLILLSAWQFGSSMLIFLAGLKNIPVTYYEAAKVDGANTINKFFKITIPILTPVIFFNLVMQLINGFMTFTQAYIIGGGRGIPLKSTLFYTIYLYQKAFTFFKMGFASAMAWFMVIIVGILNAIAFKSSSYWVHYESEGKI